MHTVELLSFQARQVRHACGHHLEASCFKTSIDLTNDVLGDCVGLDDGESAFDSHVNFPDWMLL
ncbi:hypothetical protein D3C72_2329600 [compost metagenome]